MTRPMTHSARVEMLAEVTKLATNVNFGHRAWAARQDEMTAGYPSRGGGGGGGDQSDGGVSREATEDRDDPAARAAEAFDRKLRKVRDELVKLYEMQAEGSLPRGGMKAMGDPGCQSCERVVNDQTGRAQWSPTYSTLTVEYQVREGKRTKTLKDQWRLCYWDYRFMLRAGRVASVDEVAAHLDGRRVVVSA